jgi:hypothetical protein
MNTDKYSDEEARAILKRAVDYQEQEEFQYSRKQLLDIGREMGLSEEAIVRAEQEHLAHRGVETPVAPKPTAVEVPLEQEEMAFRRHRMQDFRQHFTVYAIVITFLFLINLFTTGLNPLWAIYPALGWGIGLAIHFSVSRNFEGDEYDKQFEEWLDKREIRARKRRRRLSGEREESA